MPLLRVTSKDPSHSTFYVRIDGGVGATAVVAVLPPVRLRGSAVTIAAELGRPLYNAWASGFAIAHPALQGTTPLLYLRPHLYKGKKGEGSK